VAVRSEVGVRLRVVPNARRSEVIGVHGEAVKVKVASPALEGKANEAVLELVAETIGVPVRMVQLLSGAKARDKVIGVEGVAALEVRRRLVAAAEGGCEGI
jgi:uncharacterized protein (TIGR00251 family)